MRALAICAGLALASPACARSFDQRWHDLPKGAEAAYCGLAVADSALTISILDRPGGVERNPIFGKHPSDGTLIAAAAAKCAGHAAITSILQDHASTKWVKRWEVFSIGVQGGVVVHNVGVRFNLHLGF